MQRGLSGSLRIERRGQVRKNGERKWKELLLLRESLGQRGLEDRKKGGQKRSADHGSTR